MLCDAPGSDTIWRTTQYCPLWKYKGSGPNPPPLTSLKDLSLWACSFLGFSSLNGFSYKTRPPCIEPMTLKSIEFHTWVPLGKKFYVVEYSIIIKSCLSLFLFSSYKQTIFVTFPKYFSRFAKLNLSKFDNCI